MTLRPGIPIYREKGQLEGYAINRKTGKPRVAGTDRKTLNAAGQNNSNPTPNVTSVTNGEWELIARIVPIIVLYTWTILLNHKGHKVRTRSTRVTMNRFLCAHSNFPS